MPPAGIKVPFADTTARPFAVGTTRPADDTKTLRDVELNVPVPKAGNPREDRAVPVPKAGNPREELTKAPGECEKDMEPIDGPCPRN